jgi:hypothetical protein
MIKRWAAMLIFLGFGAYVFAGGTKEATPQNAMQASSGVATSMQALEKSTADAAFAASPKGTVNPAWKGKTFTIATLASGPNGAISGPLYFWRPYFQQLTGATYKLIGYYDERQGASVP